MNYSALTPAQQAQIADLFCDAYFNADPADFSYELGTAGVVTGRVLLVQPAASARPKKLRRVTCQRRTVPGDALTMACISNQIARLIQELENETVLPTLQAVA